MLGSHCTPSFLNCFVLEKEHFNVSSDEWFFLYPGMLLFLVTMESLASCTPLHPTIAQPVAKRFCSNNWLTGGAEFNSRLSTQPFGVFRSFLQNSRKYGLGFLKKTTTEGIPPTGPGSTCWQLALPLQSTTNNHYDDTSIVLLPILLNALFLFFCF